MKSILIFVGLFAFSTAALADGEVLSRTFQSRRGNVNLELLEAFISSKLNASINIEEMHVSYSPIEYATYILTKLRGSSYETYVVKFKINQDENATCDLLLVEPQEKGILPFCSSEHRKFSVPGHFLFKQIGLPTKNENSL